MKNLEPGAASIDESQDIAKQTEVELALLLGLEHSMRLVLQWMTRERGNNRKLATLRVAARAFERQLSRARAVSDHGGYLHLITDVASSLSRNVAELHTLRDKLQIEFEKLILRLEYVSPDDGFTLQQICEELEAYLLRVRAHGEKELDLLHRAFIANKNA